MGSILWIAAGAVVVNALSLQYIAAAAVVLLEFVLYSHYFHLLEIISLPSSHPRACPDLKSI